MRGSRRGRFRRWRWSIMPHKLHSASPKRTEQGTVHRDVKPVQHLVDPRGADQDPRPRPGGPDGGGFFRHVRDRRRHRRGHGQLRVSGAGVRPGRQRSKRPLRAGIRDVPLGTGKLEPGHRRSSDWASQSVAATSRSPNISPTFRRVSSASWTRCSPISRMSDSAARAKSPMLSRADPTEE